MLTRAVDVVKSNTRKTTNDKCFRYWRSVGRRKNILE
jgi:hypothetical protein